jgi:hypothetical protein
MWAGMIMKNQQIKMFFFIVLPPLFCLERRQLQSIFADEKSVGQESVITMPRDPPTSPY